MPRTRSAANYPRLHEPSPSLPRRVRPGRARSALPPRGRLPAQFRLLVFATCQDRRSSTTIHPVASTSWRGPTAKTPKAALMPPAVTKMMRATARPLTGDVQLKLVCPTSLAQAGLATFGRLMIHSSGQAHSRSLMALTNMQCINQLE